MHQKFFIIPYTTVDVPADENAGKMNYWTTTHHCGGYMRFHKSPSITHCCVAMFHPHCMISHKNS